MPDRPLVTIGMPVFNEGDFVEGSLAALLAQDYPSIEIIISDNASTDDTFEKCAKYAVGATNVTVHQFASNQGAAANFRYVLEKARGTYFMWASGHDLWARNYVSECVALLESNPGAVIAVGSACWIDKHGSAFDRASGWTDTRGMKPIARLFTVLWGNMHPVLGLIRRSAMDSSSPLQDIVGADLVLLSELALRGDFLHATNADWKRREHRLEAGHAAKVRRYQSAEYGLTRRSIIDRWFPLVRLPFKLCGCVVRSHELSWGEKASVLPALIAAFPARYLDGRR